MTKQFQCPHCGMISPRNKFGDITNHHVALWHPYIAKVDSMVCAKSNPTAIRVELLMVETLEKLRLPFTGRMSAQEQNRRSA